MNGKWMANGWQMDGKWMANGWQIKGKSKKKIYNLDSFILIIIINFKLIID